MTTVNIDNTNKRMVSVREAQETLNQLQEYRDALLVLFYSDTTSHPIIGTEASDAIRSMLIKQRGILYKQIVTIEDALADVKVDLSSLEYETPDDAPQD